MTQQSLPHLSLQYNSFQGSTQSNFTAVIKIPTSPCVSVSRSGVEMHSELAVIHLK